MGEIQAAHKAAVKINTKLNGMEIWLREGRSSLGCRCLWRLIMGGEAWLREPVPLEADRWQGILCTYGIFITRINHCLQKFLLTWFNRMLYSVFHLFYHTSSCISGALHNVAAPPAPTTPEHYWYFLIFLCLERSCMACSSMRCPVTTFNS
jgi:hypothetical protein